MKKSFLFGDSKGGEDTIGKIEKIFDFLDSMANLSIPNNLMN